MSQSRAEVSPDIAAATVSGMLRPTVPCRGFPPNRASSGFPGAPALMLRLATRHISNSAGKRGAITPLATAGTAAVLIPHRPRELVQAHPLRNGVIVLLVGDGGTRRSSRPCKQPSRVLELRPRIIP